MIKYSCTDARLANWVLRQVNEQPGLVFPTRKGWKAQVKLIYPGDHNQTYFAVLVTNQTELLIFVPVNSKSEPCHFKFLTGDKLVRSIKSELGQSYNSYQMIFMTSERHLDIVKDMLSETIGTYNLLMLDYEKMSFAEGNFNNPRLEYRLGSQKFDIDLIPNFLPEPQKAVTNGISNSLFYQNLFYGLGQSWLKGEKQTHLRTILKNTIPYWKQYRKKEQHAIIEQVCADLELVFQRFSFDGFSLKCESKNAENLPGSMVCFPRKPDNKKEINVWQRKIEQALEYFRDEINQISIDSLNLEA